MTHSLQKLFKPIANTRKWLLFPVLFALIGLFWAAGLCAGDWDGDAEMQKISADPFFKQLQPVFGRGVNLGDALEAPQEGDWGVVLKQEYFQRIAAAGFNTVRIPVCWATHAEKSPPYRIDEKFSKRVDWAIEQGLKRHLTVILDMHHYNGMFEAPDKHVERFLGLWRQISARYKDYAPALALELLNEPHDKLTAKKWNEILSKAIPIVRRDNPTRKIVVGPAEWNKIQQLPYLQLPEDDRNLIVTIHYYEPFHFTHQGAEWVGKESQNWVGTKWIGTKAEQQAVIRDFDRAISWAIEHRRPLYLGEFGASHKADMQSRARWTAFVARTAWQRKIGFAYWEFCVGFGVFDPQENRWREPLKRALLDAGR
ncbi:MAG: glycoside hydrolase family 5 protein [Thermoguttaceae bacterium]